MSGGFGENERYLGGGEFSEDGGRCVRCRVEGRFIDGFLLHQKWRFGVQKGQQETTHCCMMRPVAFEPHLSLSLVCARS
jgi:hypothetical protein